MAHYLLGIRCFPEMPDPNSSTVVSALLAYTAEVLKEKDTSGRVVRTAKDALTIEVLMGMAGMQ